MRTNSILILILILLFTKSYGQFKYNPQALIPFDSAFKIGKLDNGIRYIIRSNPADKGKAYFYDFFKVGAIQEKPDEYGAAHFVEHLYGDYPEYDLATKNYMQSVGLISGPDINAATSTEMTNYTLFNVPTKREGTLDSALMILKTMPFHSFPPTEVEKQRKIILEERLQLCGVDLLKARNKMHLAVTATALHETIGDTAVINHITADRLKQFHDKWYHPDNLTIIAVGDFNTSKMETRIKRIFSSIPKTVGGKTQSDYQLPDNKEPIIGIAPTDEEESSVEISYKHDTFPYTQKRLREELLDQLISGMFSQRIKDAAENWNFLFNLKYATYGNNYLDLFRYDGYEISFRTFGNIEKTLNLVLTEKKRTDKYGFTPQELIQAKKEILQNYRIHSQVGRSLPYSEYYIKCYYYLLNGEVSPSFNYYCQFVQTVAPCITLSEINNRFKEYTSGIQPIVNIEVSQRSTLPTSAEIKTILTSPLTICPYVPSAPITSLEDNTIQPGHIVKETVNKGLGTTEWSLSNEMKVVIKKTDFNPNEIVFSGFYNKNFLLNLAGKYPYLSCYGGELYDEMGYGKYSNVKLNQFLKTKHLSVSKDFHGFNGYTIPKDFETCLQLIHLKYLNQRWTELNYNKKFKQILNNKSAYNVMMDTINYLYKKRGDCFTPITQLQQIHQKVFGNPADFTFVFAGNITSDKVRPLIEKYLASITLKNKNSASVNNQSEGEKKKECSSLSKDTCLIFKSKINKSLGAIIGIGWQGYDTQYNYIYYNVVNELLHSYMENIIREKKQATYGISDYSVDYDTSTHIVTTVLEFETTPEKVTQVNEMAKASLKQFLKDGPEEKDFKFQKALFINNRLHDLKSNNWWVNLALHFYYVNGKNIVPDYVTSAQNMTYENIVRFTNALYKQGNLINLIMLPK